MDRKQTGNDHRDNQRVFRWGVVAVVVLVLLALAGYGVLSLQRAASPTMQPTTQPNTPAPPKPPAQ